MSRDLRRISFLGIVFLVLLRVSIGWQFLYEGLWKHQSQSTGNPWTAKGYLINAQGPFRSFFRGMVDDPDDLQWLDHDHVLSDWERWKKRFTNHYDLDDAQKQALEEVFNGLDAYEVPLKRLPHGKEDISRDYGPTIPKIVGYRPGKEPDQPGSLFIIKGQEFKEEHVKRLHGIAPPKGEEEYHAAVDALWKKYSSTSTDYTQELEDLLVHNPAWTGEPIKDEEGNVIITPPGEIPAYKNMLVEYEDELAHAKRESNFEHLKTKWGKIQEKKAELVGPVKALDAGLKSDAYNLLTVEQRQQPPLPPEHSRLGDVDKRTTWALIILGGLLIAGCFTRISALLGAGMVLLFYLPNPPFPGLPPQPGPEHSYIINKNFIEIVALFALTFLPTGTWFGVDGIFHRIFIGDKTGSERKTPKPVKTKDPKKPVAAKT